MEVIKPPLKELSSSNLESLRIREGISLKVSRRMSLRTKCIKSTLFRIMKVCHLMELCADFISSVLLMPKANWSDASKGVCLTLLWIFAKAAPLSGSMWQLNLVRKITDSFSSREVSHMALPFLAIWLVFQYKCDNFYHPEADGGISIKDETLGIDWKIPMNEAILSDKDLKHSCLRDFDSPFDYNVNLYPEF